MKTVGITGGIAAGKSVVTDYLRELGETVVCADEVAREVVRPGQPGHDALKAAFGDVYLLPDGTLDRKKLGDAVFSDAQMRQRLDAALHPHILSAIRQKARDAGGLVFVDAALLIETGLHRDMDAVWLVTADEEKRLRRVMRRDGLSADEARRRMDSQMQDAEKRPYADAVIDNSRDLRHVKAQVLALLSKVKGG